jgi:diguanylate cyclase (GGDEF)-like protein
MRPDQRFPDEQRLDRRAALGIRAGLALMSEAMVTSPAGVVVVLDVDRMGRFNDRFGAGAGDLLLDRVELALRRSVAGRGGATSFAGDQFLVVVPGTPEPGRLVRELRSVVHGVRVGRGRVTASAGCCSWSGTAPRALALLSGASRSLERAKGGRSFLAPRP